MAKSKARIFADLADKYSQISTTATGTSISTKVMKRSCWLEFMSSNFGILSININLDTLAISR